MNQVKTFLNAFWTILRWTGAVFVVLSAVNLNPFALYLCFTASVVGLGAALLAPLTERKST